MQTHQTASSLSPLSYHRACVLLQFDLTVVISSYRLVLCTISIWCCDTILPHPVYDIHLRATDMTTSSIGGVQIHIYLVNRTTDSLCPVQQYITCTSSGLRP